MIWLGLAFWFFFMFKGLDSDPAGNVTTIVNYDISTESKVTKRGAKDWSFDRWRSPASLIRAEGEQERTALK